MILINLGIQECCHPASWSDWFTVQFMREQSPGSTQIWFIQESGARALKPLPMFKGRFDRKRYIFLRIFFKI